MKKVLLVKPGGFYSKDDKPFPFDDYTLVVNGVKLNFKVKEETFETGRTKAPVNKTSEKAILYLKIIIDPGEEVYLISNKVPYESKSKET